MLESMLGLLTTALVVVVGLLLRALVAVAIIAAIAVPIVTGVLGWIWVRRLADRTSGLEQVGHLRWRRGNYYTPGHLWLRPRAAGALRIGVDDVAQRVLQEVTEVTVPAAGTTVNKGEVFGRIRCFNGAVTLKAPVSGVITAVNQRLRKTPALLHADPYRRAWLVDVRPRGSAHASLPTGQQARAWLAREDERLGAFLEHQLGIAAADGGVLTVPPHRLLSAEQWEALTRGFLSD